MGKPKAKTAAKREISGWVSDYTLVQDALEHLTPALSVFDGDFKLALYNRGFIDLLELPENLVEIGQPFEDFVRYNAKRGEYGPGDVEELVRERVALAEKREPHCFRRVREDGTVVEVRGNPMPGGGFVTTYTDISERVAAEAALEEGEARFRDFARAASDYFWETDENLRFSYFSQRFSEVTGVTAERLIGKTRQESGIEPDVDPEAYQQHLDDLTAHRPFRNFIHPRTLPDGTVVHLSISGTPLFDEDGIFKGYRGTGTDISERRRAEEALRESEQRYRNLVELSPDSILVHREGEIIYANPAAAALVGAADSDQLVGKSLGDLVHPDYRTLLIGRLQALEEGSTTLPLAEYKVIGLDGNTIVVDAVGGQTMIDGKPAVQSILRDITDRKQAEEALRENEERFRTVVDNLPSAVFLKDPNGHYLLVNKRYEEWYDTNTDELAGTTVHDRFSEDRAALYSADDAQVLAAGQVIHREIDADFPDGTTRTTLVSKFPIMGTDGFPLAVGGVETDITELKSLERRLARSQRMEALGKLTGGVAHDFNNLLTIIIGNLQLLERRMLKDQLNEKWIGLASDAARRGADLTSRLLTFSRRQLLKTTVFNVNELVIGMDALLVGTLGETIEVKNVLAEDPWSVRADVTQLENALLNLAFNARDAMPDGGKLILETANVVIDAHYIAQNPDATKGNYVMIAVSDTGTGMSKEVLDHVFEPFYSTKELGKGTGLGLSSVYGFVKQSGGHIKAYSEQGAGTVIKLCLPAADGDAEHLVAATVEDEEALVGDERILVVEDDSGVRQTTVGLLRELGYQVFDAEDGPTALDVLGEHPEIDLLFTDVIMAGGMKGPDLAAEARTRRPDLRVLYTSGYTENGIGREGMLLDGASLVSKPFQHSELAYRIRQTLDA